MTEIRTNRNYKDTVFRMLFKEKENLLSLYNAVNGTTPKPQKQILKLSDAYEKPLDTPELELIVTIYNINAGNNQELLGACHQLKEYAQYVDKVRKFAKEQPLAEAVEHAVDECIKKGILADFLRKNRAEAIAMSIFEYDEEKHLKNEREFGYRNGHEDGKQEGIKLGIAQGKELGIAEGKELGIVQGKELGIAIGKSGAILDLLQELGTVPEDLRKRIQDEKDIDTLQRWLKLASRVSSVTEFQLEMEKQ